jgi:two-component system phosphate regulon sensor histidine kinase PhoR
MPILLGASKILSSPQGSLIYHLLVSWAVVAGLGIALGEWRRAQQEHVYRLGGLVLGRAIYALGAIAASNWIDPVVLLPPLERGIDTASIALLAWALLPRGRLSNRTWNLLLAAMLALIAAVCGLFVMQWAGNVARATVVAYNTFWQMPIWLGWQMALVILTGYGVVRRRTEGWGTYVASLGLIVVGGILQWANPGAEPNLPIWQRLGNIAAYPLIAVAIYQDIVASLRVQSRELQDISQASLDQIKSLLYLFDASQRTSSSLDLPTVLEHAVHGIARVLNADQCAIAFPEEGNPGQMRLAAIHNPARQGRGEVVAFPLEYQLTVQQAIRRRKHIIVDHPDNVQLKVLFALLGSGETGPLLVQPLLSEESTIGAIIFGNSRSQRRFTPNEAKLCQSVAEQIVTAIQNARRYQAGQEAIARLSKAQAEDRHALQQARDQLEKLTERLNAADAHIEELEQREQAVREVRNALEIRLASSRAASDALTERLSVLESDLAQALANVEAQRRWHEEELSRQQEEWAERLQATEAGQALIQGMTAGVLMTDPNGQIDLTNVAAEILLERSSEELTGLPLEAISKDQRWQQAVATAMAGEAVRLTIRIGINTLMCDIAPLPGPDQRHETGGTVFAILQDISAESEEQQERLERLSALADQVRTPITTISNYASLLRAREAWRDTTDGRQIQFLQRIEAGVEQMTTMIDELAKLAKGEDRWSRPERQRVEIADLLAQAVADSQAQLEARDLKLDLNLPDDLPPIEADRDYMRRILTNLLENALLASSLGGQVHVHAVHSTDAPIAHDEWSLNGEHFVTVSVKDSGGGLSEEALTRVFDRGRPRGRPTGLGGSGADLALVKALVEVHGGRLWVESDPGVGTTFSFVLPVRNEAEGEREPA